MIRTLSHRFGLQGFYVYFVRAVIYLNGDKENWEFRFKDVMEDLAKILVGFISWNS